MRKKGNRRLMAVWMAAALSAAAAPTMAAEFVDSGELTAEEPVFETEEDADFSAGEEAPEETPELPEEAPLTVTENGIEYKYISEEDCYRAVNGADAEAVSVPERLYGREVKYIGKGAFQNCGSLRTFVMEGYERCVVIEENAFNGCENLKTVSVPGGFRLESGAFQNCPKLSGFYGEGYLENSFAEDAFDRDTKVVFFRGEGDYSREVKEMAEKLDILIITLVDSDDIRDIYDGGVSYLKVAGSGSNVYAADFDDSAKVIEISGKWGTPVTVRRKAFYGTKVEEVILSETTEEVESMAFYDCKNLKAVVIPSNVTKIASDAFGESPKTVIYAPKGSYALEFAKKAKIPYEELDTKKIAAPKELTYTRANNTITLQWSKVPFADRYQIFKYNSETKRYAAVASVPESAAHTYRTSLRIGETGKFKVRACSRSNVYSEHYSLFSPTVSAASSPDRPKITSVSNKKAGSLTVNWTKMKRAVGYVITRYEEGRPNEQKVIKTIKNGSAVKFTDTDVRKGKSYVYKVRPFGEDFCSDGKHRVYGPFSAPVTAKCR